MANHIRTKPLKKQPGRDSLTLIKSSFRAPASAHADVHDTRRMERAVAALEESVIAVQEANKGHAFHDVEFLYWDRQLKNIAAPVSLALSEYMGPRKFHNHFRHDPAQEDRLYPVYSPPLPTLARVCKEALLRCNELVGVRDRQALTLRTGLEQALRRFLACYKA